MLDLSSLVEQAQTAVSQESALTRRPIDKTVLRLLLSLKHTATLQLLVTGNIHPRLVASDMWPA
jgi:hypothetical protein